jgi:hypothetical protein
MKLIPFLGFLKTRLFRKIVAVTIATVLVSDSIVFVKSVNAQECRKNYRQDKRRYQNRTAHLAIQNTTDRSVSITLYHPDSQAPQGTWTVAPGAFAWIPKSGYIIADDWGISVNGGCIYYLGEVADYLIGGGNIPFYKVYVDKESDGLNLDGYIVLRVKRRR